MDKINTLREKLEGINQTHGKKFGLYNGDFAKNIGMREKKGTIEYLDGYIDGLFNI